MSDPITPLNPDQLAHQEASADKDGYVHRVLVSVDQAANVILDGTPDETISSRAARWDTEEKGVKHEVGKIVSEGLGLIQHNHGAKAIASDYERAKNVEKIEEGSGDL